MSGAAHRALQVVATSWAVPMQVLPIAEALARAGWDVEVACPPGPETELLAEKGLRHLPVHFSRRWVSAGHAATLRALVRVLRAGRYDVVHLHGPFPAMLGRIAARLTGTPAIYHCRGTLFEAEGSAPSQRLLRLVYAQWERRLAPATAWAFTLNAADAEDLIDAGIPRERVTCLGVGSCGLDLGVWNPERRAAERQRVRARLGIAPDKPVVGFVGRIVREKGVRELFEAFVRVREAGHDAHLLLVGGTLASERDQETHREVQRRTAELGLEPHVTMTGHIPDPAEVVATMDLLVLPSHREGFGQVLVEAGALGIPVVAAASRGARHAVIDGETGLLVPVRDPDALARAITRLLTDPELAHRLGQRAARRAREELGSERVLSRILAVYRRLAGGEDDPRRLAPARAEGLATP